MNRKYSPEKQQELMESSLRNVRALVDQIESEEVAQKRAQRRIFAILAVAVVVLVGVVGYIVLRQPGGTPVTVSPMKTPPAAPAPSR